MRYVIFTMCCLFLFLVIVPSQFVHAHHSLEGYDTLTEGGIPFLNWNEGGLTISSILSVLFILSVGIAAILAVIMLAIGGFKYMTSESPINLGDAKQQISNAIIGLLIVLLSVAILYTIHEDIVGMNLFGGSFTGDYF